MKLPWTILMLMLLIEISRQARKLNGKENYVLKLSVLSHWVPYLLSRSPSDLQTLKRRLWKHTPIKSLTKLPLRWYNALCHGNYTHNLNELHVYMEPFVEVVSAKWAKRKSLLLRGMCGVNLLLRFHYLSWYSKSIRSFESPFSGTPNSLWGCCTCQQ